MTGQQVFAVAVWVAIVLGTPMVAILVIEWLEEWL
jgi:hypothetical protein